MQASNIIQDEQELRGAQDQAERLLAGCLGDGGVDVEARTLAEAAATLHTLIAKVRDRNDRLRDTEQALGVMQAIVRDLAELGAERSPGEVRNLARTLEVVLHSALENGESSDDGPRKRAR